jgi:alkyl hydroperoxide reductase subunit F
MLDNAIKTQLAGYLEKLRHPIELIGSLDDSPAAQQMRELLEAINGLSAYISVRFDGTAKHRPSFAIAQAGQSPRIHFAGVPMGHEFSSLVLALLNTGGHPPKIDEGLSTQICTLDCAQPLHFETFVSLSCHNCPDVVQALNTLAVLHPRIEHTMIDGALFQDEVKARQIMAVPSLFLNHAPFAQGRLGLEEIVSRLDRGAGERTAALINAKKPFDILVVGGGPAGAAAAIYGARKGLHVGIVAERFGGQVQDTLAIENFISVPHTEGPQLARALHTHVEQYGVDVMTGQRALALGIEGSLRTLTLAGGGQLKAKTVVIATGARWREMGVPGEQEYKARGVCFCPHCDGPLFKGKAVAVIGGGNSGVEAAIDLAGLAAHVVLLEFDSRLRADAVLQEKLHTLPNVRIITGALTTEVLGDGHQVNGLSYVDRQSNEQYSLALEGIFVQIGLLPNTDWLKGTLNLNARGEVEIDARCASSMPAVFAAGDCTHTPYKQIIIALGEGAKASLSAFDELIRST